MPDWSVKIEGKPAVFTPDIDGTPSGTPLKVVQGDLVSWNNTTDQEHWPAPDDPDTHGSFMTDPVEPDTVVDRLQHHRASRDDDPLPLLSCIRTSTARSWWSISERTERSPQLSTRTRDAG